MYYYTTTERAHTRRFVMATAARISQVQVYRQDGVQIIRDEDGVWWAASGSTDALYSLGDGTRCECAGYFYRQSCKHVKAMQAVLRRTILVGAAIRAKEREIEEKYGEARRRVLNVI